MIRLKKIWDIIPQGREEPQTVTNSVLHPGRLLCLDSATHPQYRALQNSRVSFSMITSLWGLLSSFIAFVPTTSLVLT